MRLLWQTLYYLKKIGDIWKITGFVGYPPHFMLPFNNQIAIVTGGADGLGRATAQKLITKGATVCLFDVNQDKLRQAAEELGPKCHWKVTNVTSSDAVSKSVAETVNAIGNPTILVNCAGITGQTNIKGHEVDPDDFDRVIAINVRGTFLTCKNVLPHMLSGNYGRILNIASIAGKDGNAGMLAYSASKAAVIGMTKSLGKDYADTGITVNALAPAVIRTALVDAMPEIQVDYMTSRIPMQRCGTLDEFTDMACFIVSPENSFTTGFTFDLSGGRAVY